MISNEDGYNYLKSLVAESQFEIYSDEALHNRDFYKLNIVTSKEENDRFAAEDDTFFLPMLFYSASADGNEFVLDCVVEMPSSLGADSLAERVSLVNDRGESVELICYASMSKPNHYVCWGHIMRVGNSSYISKPTYENQLVLNNLLEDADSISVIVDYKGETDYEYILTEDELMYLREASYIATKMLEEGFLY